MKRLGQQDLLRHVVGIEWTEPAHLLNHFRCDSLRLVILRPAIHYTMPNRGQCITPAAFLESNPSERPLPPCDPAPSPMREKLSA